MGEPAVAAPAGSFAEIAVELRVGEMHVGEMSFAAAALCMIRADHLYRMDRLAIECGIDSPIARKIILDEKRFNSLIAEAHRLFKRMIPHQEEIMRIIEDGESRKGVPDA